MCDVDYINSNVDESLTFRLATCVVEHLPIPSDILMDVLWTSDQKVLVVSATNIVVYSLLANKLVSPPCPTFPVVSYQEGAHLPFATSRPHFVDGLSLGKESNSFLNHSVHFSTALRQGAISSVSLLEEFDRFAPSSVGTLVLQSSTDGVLELLSLCHKEQTSFGSLTILLKALSSELFVVKLNEVNDVCSYNFPMQKLTLIQRNSRFSSEFEWAHFVSSSNCSNKNINLNSKAKENFLTANNNNDASLPLLVDHIESLEHALGHACVATPQDDTKTTFVWATHGNYAVLYIMQWCRNTSSPTVLCEEPYLLTACPLVSIRHPKNLIFTRSAIRIASSTEDTNGFTYTLESTAGDVAGGLTQWTASVTTSSPGFCKLNVVKLINYKQLSRFITPIHQLYSISQSRTIVAVSGVAVHVVHDDIVQTLKMNAQVLRVVASSTHSKQLSIEIILHTGQFYFATTDDLEHQRLSPVLRTYLLSSDALALWTGITETTQSQMTEGTDLMNSMRVRNNKVTRGNAERRRDRDLLHVVPSPCGLMRLSMWSRQQGGVALGLYGSVNPGMQVNLKYASAAMAGWGAKLFEIKSIYAFEVPNDTPWVLNCEFNDDSVKTATLGSWSFAKLQSYETVNTHNDGFAFNAPENYKDNYRGAAVYENAFRAAQFRESIVSSCPWNNILRTTITHPNSLSKAVLDLLSVLTVSSASFLGLSVKDVVANVDSLFNTDAPFDPAIAAQIDALMNPAFQIGQIHVHEEWKNALLWYYKALTICVQLAVLTSDFWCRLPHSIIQRALRSYLARVTALLIQLSKNKLNSTSAMVNENDLFLFEFSEVCPLCSACRAYDVLSAGNEYNREFVITQEMNKTCHMCHHKMITIQ